jgi:hypothetical protein
MSTPPEHRRGNRGCCSEIAADDKDSLGLPLARQGASPNASAAPTGQATGPVNRVIAFFVYCVESSIKLVHAEHIFWGTSYHSSLNYN